MGRSPNPRGGRGGGSGTPPSPPLPIQAWGGCVIFLGGGRSNSGWGAFQVSQDLLSRHRHLLRGETTIGRTEGLPQSFATSPSPGEEDGAPTERGTLGCPGPLLAYILKVCSIYCMYIYVYIKYILKVFSKRFVFLPQIIASSAACSGCSSASISSAPPTISSSLPPP